MIRTLIVDDEPLARRRIRALLAADFTVVGEAGHGEMAVAMIEDLRPDLVFLDVHMPGMSGIEVIEAVGADVMPLTVFVTAYEAFAVRAFEVRALDYILKPFDDIRFSQVLERVRNHSKGRKHALSLKAAVKDAERLPRLIARSHGAVRLIAFDDIDWIAGAGDYVEVYEKGRSHLVNETLSALTNRLPASAFIRVHRSAIVRFDRIREVRPGTHGDGVIRLTGGEEVRFSRRYRQALQDWLLRG
jgi:two-component system, LytTR family, response regulator